MCIYTGTDQLGTDQLVPTHVLTQSVRSRPVTCQNPDISGGSQWDKPLAGLIRTLVDCMSHKYADVNKEKQKDAEVMMHSLETQSEYVKTED